MNDDRRLRHFIDGYCSGDLSDAEFREFEDALRNNPALRRELVETRALEADLRDHVSGVAGFVGPSPPSGETARSIPVPTRKIWVVAAVITVLAMGLSVLFLQREPDVVAGEVDSGVAVLIRAIDAEWQELSLREGASLAPGLLHLRKGIAELEFYSGASVILQAPARLEILSEAAGKLHAGRLRAEVPYHARGFTITSPEIELVDLGTSFGIDVRPAGGTDVHVFDGEVELFPVEEDSVHGNGESLSAGDGRAFGVAGSVKKIDADDERFLSREKFDELARTRHRKSIQRWRAFAAERQQDENILAHYGFQPVAEASRSLPNLVPGEEPGLDGAVIGATWAEGRWPGKSALDFKRPSDRVRINVRGSIRSMTLIAWIRVDGLDHKFSSLLLSDGWSPRGGVHWQIRRDSRIELAVRYGERGKNFTSEVPSLMRRTDFGRWTQVAVTYEGDSGEVTHYQDGEVIGSTQEVAGIPITIGAAEIGNWTPPPRKVREIRNFNGRMDELMIFDRALSPMELAEIFQNSKP